MTAGERITGADAAVMLGEIDRFVGRSILPLVERPEITITQEQLAEVTRQAEALGALNLGIEPGAGLWERADTDGAGLSVGILTRVAAANAGVAWHLHRLALARRLAVSLGAGDLLRAGPVIATVQGAYGLCRSSLARYLRGGIDADDADLLRDCFRPASPSLHLVLHAAAGWERLVAPEFAGQIVWTVRTREQVGGTVLDPSLGLDEIPSVAWRPGASADRISPDPATSRRVYAETLLIDALGIMAIATGAASRAYRIARDHAATRRQGGVPIDRHPAVQLMLGSIRGRILNAETTLGRVAAQRLAAGNIGDVLALRSVLQPALIRAATDAMQVMGGIGYMRDVGVEKILRDCHHLALVGGTPTELCQFVSAWEAAA